MKTTVSFNFENLEEAQKFVAGITGESAEVIQAAVDNLSPEAEAPKRRGRPAKPAPQVKELDTEMNEAEAAESEELDDFDFDTEDAKMVEATKPAKLTQDDVLKALNAYMKKHKSADKAKALLAKFTKGKPLSTLDPAEYSKVIAATLAK